MAAGPTITSLRSLEFRRQSPDFFATRGDIFARRRMWRRGRTHDVDHSSASIVLTSGAMNTWLTSLNPVRATADERTRRLPGDELIAQPLAALDHAITIHRPPRDVWPWLAQMGAGSRGGWYSYDALDNARRPSSSRIVPELQSLSQGMVFPALPGVRDGFTLLAFEPERFLLLGWLASDRLLMTWSFVLKQTEDGSTRLMVRARGGQGYQFHHLPWWLARRIVPLIHFVMQRRQLLGIRQRAEACA